MLKERFDSAPLVVDETNNKQDPKTMAKCSTNVALAANSYEFFKNRRPKPPGKNKNRQPKPNRAPIFKNRQVNKKKLGSIVILYQFLNTGVYCSLSSPTVTEVRTVQLV